MTSHGSSDSQPTVALLTPRARGAIASLSISGPHAWKIVRQFLCPATSHKTLQLERATSDGIVFARWASAEGEEVVVRCSTALEVEIHCHGGLASSAAIIADLRQAGCREQRWSDVSTSEDNSIIAQARV